MNETSMRTDSSSVPPKWGRYLTLAEKHKNLKNLLVGELKTGKNDRSFYPMKNSHWLWVTRRLCEATTDQNAEYSADTDDSLRTKNNKVSSSCGLRSPDLESHLWFLYSKRLRSTKICALTIKSEKLLRKRCMPRLVTSDWKLMSNRTEEISNWK